jgi:SAM-dependent methyltransferase
VSITHLTDEAFWDDYWASLRLPVEIQKSSGFLVREITDVFDRFLPSKTPLSVLEVGGAPGQYAAYVQRELGHAVTIFDSSPVGCAKARENFELLGLPAEIVEGDMFNPPPELPRFDAVYSLGLIEHFDDVTTAVRAHLDFVAPGGLLILGVPNLAGVNGPLVRRLSPSFFSKHYAQATHESTWNRFERELRLQRLFRAHLGGFDPGMFWRCESRKFGDRVLAQSLRYLSALFERKGARFVRRANARAWSAYLIGVYRLA